MGNDFIQIISLNLVLTDYDTNFFTIFDVETLYSKFPNYTAQIETSVQQNNIMRFQADFKTNTSTSFKQTQTHTLQKSEQL